MVMDSIIKVIWRMCVWDRGRKRWKVSMQRGEKRLLFKLGFWEVRHRRRTIWIHLLHGPTIIADSTHWDWPIQGLTAGTYLICILFHSLLCRGPNTERMYGWGFIHSCSNVSHPEPKRSAEKSERVLSGDLRSRLLIHPFSSLLDQDCSTEHSNPGQTLEEPNST